MACCADHWFLTDDDPPVPDETSITSLPVTGTLPAALSGTYLVIGSNPTGAPDAGEPGRPAAMVHAIAVDAGGTVSYRNRWITTDAAAPLGREPVPGPRHADNDGVATHLFTFGSTILALGDGTLAYELTADLATHRLVDLGGGGRGLRPRVELDRYSGALHLVGVGPGSAQTHVTVAAGAMTRTTCSLDDTPRVDDLAITRDHVVFLADGLLGVSPRSVLHERRVEWSTIEGGARRLAGAHDDTRGVVVHTTGPALERWTLRPRSTTVEHLIVDDLPLTFPNRNPGVPARGQRYLWTCSAHGIHRHDLVADERASHAVGTDHRPAEFRFVTDPARTGSEDGGWLVGLIHDDAHAAADLLFLDAGCFDAGPIATVHIPRRVPNGTHAAWIPADCTTTLGPPARDRLVDVRRSD